MESVFRSRFFRGLIVFMFAGVALRAGWFAVSLFIGAATRHGSPGGTILSIGLGLILLVLSPSVFLVGIVYWTLSQPSPGDKNGPYG